MAGHRSAAADQMLSGPTLGEGTLAEKREYAKLRAAEMKAVLHNAARVFTESLEGELQ